MGKVESIKPEPQRVIPVQVTEDGVVFQAMDESTGEVVRYTLTLLELIKSEDVTQLLQFQQNSYLYTLIQLVATSAKGTNKALDHLIDAVDGMSNAQAKAISDAQTRDPFRDIMDNPMFKKLQEQAGLGDK